MERKIPFSPTDILIPKDASKHEKWAVVACDQFTSQPEYWAEVEKIVGDDVSTLGMVLPEAYLGTPNEQKMLDNISATMEKYLENGVFTEYKDALIIVDRTLKDGKVRRGVIGALRLSDYDYSVGSTSKVRATEGTVKERIPPRMKIREKASLELPHVMVLIDDATKTIIEGIDVSPLKVVYDFELMMGGGHVKGYLLEGEAKEKFMNDLDALAERCEKENKMVIAIGDGNHSLATAKELAKVDGSEKAQSAMVELVNIHSDALKFEPIYRVLFNVSDDIITCIKDEFVYAFGGTVEYFTKDKHGKVYVHGLDIKAVQEFIDKYLSTHPDAYCDYIHGEDVLMALAEKPNTVCFKYSGLSKGQLFSYVAQNGVLPKKTFSMGDACDKRYYLEARRLK